MKTSGSQRLIPLVADLHIHSALSPCGGEGMVPNTVLPRICSFDLGVEVFSITDHNSGANNRAFAKASEAKKLLFIPGIELQSSEEIHLLGYFPTLENLETFCQKVVRKGLKDELKNDPHRFGHQNLLDVSGTTIGEEEAMLSMSLSLTLEALVEQIHQHSGIAVGAHLDRGFSVVSQLGFIPPQLKLDAVEVSDVSKLDLIRSRYLQGRELNIICSSDSHHLDLIPQPRMKLWVPQVDVASCLASIKGYGPGKITLRPERSYSRAKAPAATRQIR